MTNDDFLDVLRDDWRRQGVDLARVRRLTERRRHAVFVSLGSKLGGAALSLLFGGWFAWRAAVEGDAVYAVGALALFVALPAILVDYVAARRLTRVGREDTPFGLIAHARDQAEGTRRLLRGFRVAATILLVSSGALLLLAAAGRATPAVALAIASIWSVTALGVWLWQIHRGRRLAAEVVLCDALLAEYGEAESA